MPSSPGYIRGKLVIPATCQVKLDWQLPNGKLASNVLHAIVPDSFTFVQSDVDDVFNGIGASTGWSELNPFLHTDTRLLGVEIKDLREADLPSVPSTAPAANGTSTANALPEGVALVVSLLTAKAGRSNRGRVYLGGFTDDATDSAGHAVDGLVTAAQDFILAVQAAMTAKNFELAIGHRGHDPYTSPATGQTVLAEAPGSVPVTGVVVKDPIFDSQRRRKA
jgi:hypothetical protein